jgi:MHS family alpha-ketoglutarate permease-like MFS transporter
LQGVSQGGEYGTSATYLAEIAHPERRGFYSGVWYNDAHRRTALRHRLAAGAAQKVFLTAGSTARVGLAHPVRHRVRILLAIYTLFMRRDMHESDHFTEASKLTKGEAGVCTLMRLTGKPMLKVVGITIGGTSAFYTYTTYMQKFLKLSVGLTDGSDNPGGDDRGCWLRSYTYSHSAAPCRTRSVARRSSSHWRPRYALHLSLAHHGFRAPRARLWRRC